MLSTIAGGGIFAAVIAGWGQIKAFLAKVVSIVIKTDSLKARNGTLKECFAENVLKNMKRLYFGNVGYVTNTCYLKKYNRFFPAIFEAPNNSFYLYGKNLVYVNFNKLSITYLRGTFDSKTFFQETSKIYNEIITQEDQEDEDDFISEFYVRVLQGANKKKMYSQSANNQASPQEKLINSPSDYFSGTQADTSIWENLGSRLMRLMKGINFDPTDIGESKRRLVERIHFSEQGKALLKNVEIWKKSEKWFKERNIAHRRGALLSGPPGSGKSQTVKEICRKLGMRLYIFDLATMNNQEFHEFFMEEVSLPCVILFEDIDSVFDGRKNIAQEEDGVTFDSFINHLSGAADNEGRFIIVTTNHPEKLDPALIRSGRLDDKFEIGYLEPEAKRFVANKILKDWPEEIEKILSDDQEWLGADFENKCIQIAVEKFWEKQKSS